MDNLMKNEINFDGGIVEMQPDWVDLADKV